MVYALRGGCPCCIPSVLAVLIVLGPIPPSRTPYGVTLEPWWAKRLGACSTGSPRKTGRRSRTRLKIHGYGLRVVHIEALPTSILAPRKPSPLGSPVSKITAIRHCVLQSALCMGRGWGVKSPFCLLTEVYTFPAA